MRGCLLVNHLGGQLELGVHVRHGGEQLGHVVLARHQLGQGVGRHDGSQVLIVGI